MIIYGLTAGGAADNVIEGIEEKNTPGGDTGIYESAAGEGFQLRTAGSPGGGIFPDRRKSD